MTRKDALIVAVVQTPPMPPKPTIADYLDLSPVAAIEQWRQVLRRQPKSRQDDFTPVETLLCLASFFVIDRRKFGGANKKPAPTPIPELSVLFRRPPSSILAKMANLDGSMRNSAKNERSIFAVLTNNTDQLGDLYRRILDAARHVGIGPVALPDFLDATGDDRRLLLAGEQELGVTDVERLVEEELALWMAARPDSDLAETERLLLGAVRVGQHRFASAVLANYQNRCGFCGLRQYPRRTGIRGLLFASHIKPWRDCNGAERLDFRNGVAACPTHDVAFDTGLLTLSSSLDVILSPALSRAIKEDSAAAAAFGAPPLAKTLLLGKGAEPPAEKYLLWHRDRVFVAIN